MPNGTDQPAARPTPVVEDLHAVAAQLQARAAADYAAQQAATRTHQQQGGTGQRDGILPGGSTR